MVILIIIILMLLGIIPNPCVIPDPDNPDDIVILDIKETDLLFISPDCNGCVEVKKICERLQKENYDLIIINIHGDMLEKQLTKKYQIKQVPTLIIRETNKEVKRYLGNNITEKLCRNSINKKVTIETKETFFSGVYIFTSSKNSIDFVSQRVINNTKKNTPRYIEYFLEKDKAMFAKYNIQYNPTIIYIFNGNEMGRYVSVKKFPLID